MHLREYLGALFHGWVGRMSGIASIALLFLPYILPTYFANSRNAERAVWIAAAICFLIANYAAWLVMRDALEAEIQRHRGSDIQGEVVRGYLDLHSYVITASVGQWMSLERGCALKLYVEAANHNDQATWFKPEQTKLELRIGERSFDGKWEHVLNGLTLDDPDIPDPRLIDIFDTLQTRPLQQATPWKGYLGFFVENFDRKLLESGTAITASVKVSIKDTLNKYHVIEGGDVRLLIAKLCLPNEIRTKKQ